MNRYPYIRKEFTQIELAYFAGIIDGEGCMYIGNFDCNKKTGIPYFQTHIQVCNTDKNLIDWIQNTFGGKVSIKSRERTDRPRKLAYLWNSSGERVTHLCEVLLPYLIVKKKECEIMLKMRATYSKNHCEIGTQGIQPMSLDIVAYRQSLMNEMRSLHIRTWSHKNKGHLPQVAMPQVLNEV